MTKHKEAPDASTPPPLPTFSDEELRNFELELLREGYMETRGELHPYDEYRWYADQDAGRYVLNEHCVYCQQDELTHMPAHHFVVFAFGEDDSRWFPFDAVSDKIRQFREYLYRRWYARQMETKRNAEEYEKAQNEAAREAETLAAAMTVPYDDGTTPTEQLSTGAPITGNDDPVLH